MLVVNESYTVINTVISKNLIFEHIYGNSNNTHNIIVNCDYKNHKHYNDQWAKILKNAEEHYRKLKILN